MSFTFPPLIWAQEEPGKVIIETVDEALRILKNPTLQMVEKWPERRQKMWELLEPVFSFEQISKRALGRHWKTCTIQQRQEFTQLFTEILKDAYLVKADRYYGQKIVYIQEKVRGNRSKIRTNFITNDGKKIAVTFSKIKNSESWKIYDVIIEGVSMVGNYRSQFNSILMKSSFEELLQKMTEKRDALSQN